MATGVLIGLGTATKLYPLFLLGADRWSSACASGAGATWSTPSLAAAGVVAACSTRRRTSAGADEWKRFWTFNSERGPDLGSIWLRASARPATRRSPRRTVNHWSWALFGALVRRASRWSGFRAPSTPRLAQLGFLVVAGFLLVNKVYSPQYVLWLLPLAVLARPRWRDQLIWQAVRGRLLRRRCGGTSTATSQPGGGDDAGFYWVAIVIRMAGELYLVGDRGARRAVARARPGADRRQRSAADVRLRTSVDAVERRRGVAHPHVDEVADRGRRRRRAGRNSIEACMCGGSAKSRCLPSTQNGERVSPMRVHAAAGHDRGAGLEAGVARGGLEADAVRGAAADDEQVAVARGAAAAVAEARRRARARCTSRTRRGDPQRLEVAEPQVGADPRASSAGGAAGGELADLGRLSNGGHEQRPWSSSW